MKKIIIAATVMLICCSAVSAGAQSDAVSLGKTYQLITPASSAYPDTSANKLTNGVYASPTEAGSYYQSPEFVGFNRSNVDGNGNFVIVIDLGSVMNDFSRFEISYLNETEVGIFAPVSVTFSVSETRNENYTSVGTQAIDVPEAAAPQVNKATVTPEGPVSGQYVMIEIKLRESFDDGNGNTVTPGWVFLDEISVYGTDGDGNVVSEDDTSQSHPQTGNEDDTAMLAYFIIGLTSLLMICGIIMKRKYKEPK